MSDRRSTHAWVRNIDIHVDVLFRESSPWFFFHILVIGIIPASAMSRQRNAHRHIDAGSNRWCRRVRSIRIASPFWESRRGERSGNPQRCELRVIRLWSSFRISASVTSVIFRQLCPFGFSLRFFLGLASSFSPCRGLGTPLFPVLLLLFKVRLVLVLVFVLVDGFLLDRGDQSNRKP